MGAGRLGSRSSRLAALAAGAACCAVLTYSFFVHTRLGQRLDAVAFVRRAAVTEATTRRTDRLLGTISVASLIGAGSALTLVALARRRTRLALAVVAALSASIVSAEVLKLWVLTRPVLGDFAGVEYNTFPSGHAAIGVALSLALVMVAPPRLGRAAAIVAALVSTAFGTAVLSSGWHRPSDTIGAYLITLACFAAAAAVLAHRNDDPSRSGRLEPDAPTSRPLLVTAALALLTVLLFVLSKSVDVSGLRTVIYAAPYVAACVGIDVVGVLVVEAFYVLQRSAIAPGIHTPATFNR